MAASNGTTDSGGARGTASFSEDVPRPLGRYLLLRRIARGGMGEVFLATTTGIEGAERPVVVKIIRREHATDPSFIARFLDEARVQAQLQHSGVAQVIDATIDDRTGEPYAVVEHVEGKSLGDVRARALQIGRAVGWADAVAISTLIAEALAHVHERQDPSGKGLAIVHRDLSPQNVMVSYIGECKIIDFGTARGQNRRCHTVAGVVFAKPGYVAPEVANGDSGDARVDIYALGVMLWELCAGRRFLQGDAGLHMAAVARNAKNLPPIAAEVGAPIELDAIIGKLTAFDRDARYLAARTAASDLARLLAAAEALPTGERGVRARVAAFMSVLFPGEPGKTRREFARLVAESRDLKADAPTPRRPPSAPPPAPPAPLAPPREGEVLAGTRYRLIRELGRGASSIVYEAEHLDLGRRVALKLISTEHGAAAEIAARFRREARTLSRLAHEGLVTVHDVGQSEGERFFCVMELLEGETLEARLARDKSFEVRDALRIVQRVLAALEVAHGAALVHRDIKPANVFLPRSGGLKLLDFGLARNIDETQPDAASRGFTIFGTPEYMAPEQAASGQIDARADLYALGCVLYEMLAGRLPFEGPSSVAILDAKVKGSPMRLDERAPTRGIPDAVDDLVMKALSRHPSQRFQTATEMRQAIEAVLDKPARRSGLRRVAVAALALSGLFAAFAFTAKGKQLRASVPWLHARPAVVAVSATPPEAVPAATADQPDSGTLDEGEDGDVVDDTLPAAPPPETSATPVVAPATAQPEAQPAPAAPTAQPIAAAEPAPPEKPHHRKRGKHKASAKNDDSQAKQASPKPDKPARRKHKAKVAHADQ
ncbi:Serine/threonine kinase PKN9 [Minicystis rosea]|nr:Serine/threonine kinase PKN9 [Minicystis rosea]